MVVETGAFRYRYIYQKDQPRTFQTFRSRGRNQVHGGENDVRPATKEYGITYVRRAEKTERSSKVSLFYVFTFVVLTVNIFTGLWNNIPRWTFPSVNSIKPAQNQENKNKYIKKSIK